MMNAMRGWKPKLPQLRNRNMPPQDSRPIIERETNGASNGDAAGNISDIYGGHDNSPLPWVTLRLLGMGVLVSMGGFIFGYDTGQISGFLAMSNFKMRYGQLDHDTGDYYFSNVRIGLIVGLLSIGTLIGALIAGPIADIIGRKRSVFWWCAVFHVGNIVMISAPTHHWYQIMMGRWVVGLSVGSLSLMVPMYMAETAPFQIRGALISTYQLFITLGIFVAACINFGTNKHYSDTAQWRIPMGIGFIWPLILGFGILFFPETPRYDFRKGRVDRAKKTMETMYGVSVDHWVIYKELEEIKAKLSAESRDKKGVWGDMVEMFTAPRMFYRISLGILLQMFQQLTGANYFFYYGTLIFQGVEISPFVTQMILNGINFGTTFLGLYLIEHYGRRKSLIAGSAWMFICFMIFASVGHFSLDRAHPEKTQGASIALIVFASLFILGFASTWGPMVWTIIGELYPSKYRARSMAFATASNWLWNFLLAFFTNFIVSAIDFRYGYVFAACNVLGGLIVFFFVMEGRKRTLEEIDTMYIDHVLPWKSENWQAPTFADIRKGSLAGWGGAGGRSVGDAEASGATSSEAERNLEKPELPQGGLQQPPDAQLENTMKETDH